MADSFSIYTITFSFNNSGQPNLVLRQSGHDLSMIKTANRVGIMSWISKNTTILIPDAIAYDISVYNPITHEYTLLSYVDKEVPGEIHSEWDTIDSLSISLQGEIVIAQIVDETF